LKSAVLFIVKIFRGIIANFDFFGLFLTIGNC